jgi:hypothetical protein
METVDDMAVALLRPPADVAFALLPPQAGGPAPTLLLFAMAGADTLNTEPYCRVGRLLHARGWNVVSLDLPCHGDDRRPGEPPELAGWAVRVGAGEDIVAPFRQRVNDVVEHLVATGIADPSRIACVSVSGDSQAHAVTWQEHATLDTLRDRFILLRVYGGKGLVFGFEIQNSWESTNAGSTLNVE